MSQLQKCLLRLAIPGGWEAMILQNFKMSCPGSAKKRNSKGFFDDHASLFHSMDPLFPVPIPHSRNYPHGGNTPTYTRI